MKWNGFKKIYDKISLGVLRVEVIALCGVVVVCLVKVGGIVLV